MRKHFVMSLNGKLVPDGDVGVVVAMLVNVTIVVLVVVFLVGGGGDGGGVVSV